ncbi:general secretion pathway protein J [Pseudoxanthomonas sp. GM95]|uniref:general secretion pathway protein GspJ n=1 Tax=Pseudoxanthomonas sp. GM95 TaxID=1881043 RepID=UPI0008CD8829|nr:general secretion pathway protein GspJ [Pseudoxanthomonas sp. GM95]SEK45415.1 general secretion pathway protein J [Pseudoxanthomonas sp. GM95]
MKRAQAGFTLMEILLATLLLAAGLAVGFATLRAATAMVHRGEVTAARNERIRAVQGFLRSHLASAQAIAYAVDEQKGIASRFAGSAGQMRFVADIPDYLGRGGPYLHDVEVVEDGTRLQVGLAMVQSGQTIVEPGPARPPELLADHLKSVRFRYRGLLPDGGGLGDWQDGWSQVETLPVQVSIEIEADDGTHWPDMIVTLAQGNGTAHEVTP